VLTEMSGESELLRADAFTFGGAGHGMEP
jgi:hypothetical protein